MNWNKHGALEGSHAFLSASGYHWLNYTDEKLIDNYKNKLAVQRGTELHEFASNAIKLRQRLQGNTKTLAQFVNDAIGYSMSSEVLLYYSDNCFGTADAIYFGKQKDSDRLILRIHDLKTGQTQAHIEQLMIYAALFCLEYKVKPGTIDIELRLYQYNDITYHCPQADEILPIMDKIIRFDKIIENIRKEENL